MMNANKGILFMIFCTSLFLSSCQNSRIQAKKALALEVSRREASRQESMRHYKLGTEAYENSNLDDAFKHLTAAVQADQRNSQAWMMLGIVEFSRDHMFEAASAFHRVCLLEPMRYEPHFNIGIILETFGLYKRAAESYEAALKLAPNQLEVMENLARCYIRSNANLDQAKELVDRAMVSEHRPEWRLWLREQSRQLASKRGEKL